MNYMLEYFEKMKSGEIVVSKRLYKQYEQLVNDMYESEQFEFNIELANRPIEFIERFCRHSKGEWAGKNIELELFQKAYINALFGFVDRDTGLRRFTESFFISAVRMVKPHYWEQLHCIC